MRVACKFIAAASSSAALGILLGSVPYCLQTYASAENAKLPEKITAYRSAFEAVEAFSPEPGVIKLSGAHVVGRPSKEHEIFALVVEIIDAVGKAIVDDEFDRFDVAKDGHSVVHPFAREYRVPPGKYVVDVYGHNPAGTELRVDGSTGRAKGGESTRVVVVE